VTLSLPNLYGKFQQVQEFFPDFIYYSIGLYGVKKGKDAGSWRTSNRMGFRGLFP
jgi:hypothetical protein